MLKDFICTYACQIQMNRHEELELQLISSPDHGDQFSWTLWLIWRAGSMA